MAPIIQLSLVAGANNTLKTLGDQDWHGRIYAPDPRDRLHPMSRALVGPTRMSPAELKRRRQAPAKGPTLNQGATPRCVMYSAATALGAAPITYKHDPLKIVQTPIAEPEKTYPDLYTWAGEDYEGTSVRAGQEWLIKALRSKGYIWATSLDEAKDYVSRVGSSPIILGIDWLEGMDEPQKIQGDYYLNVEGPVVGGHAICCLWFDKKRKAWKLQNTWDVDWGDDGIVYLPDPMFDYLVFQANGEAVSFIESPL